MFIDEINLGQLSIKIASVYAREENQKTKFLWSNSPNFVWIKQRVSQLNNLMSPEHVFHVGNCPPPTKTSFRLYSPGSLSLPDLQSLPKFLFTIFFSYLFWGSSPSAPLQPSLILITFWFSHILLKKLILLVYNGSTVLLVSPVQQSESTVHIHLSPLCLDSIPV